MDDYHIPVLPNETIEYLKVTKGEKYIDCTLGGGGHTAKILELGGQILGIDADSDSISHAAEIFKEEIKRSQLILRRGNFAHLHSIASDAGFTSVTGILLDLGVSSHQLDTPDRGFSFSRLGALDMRLDQTLTVSAADILKMASEKELAHIFRDYGEEPYSHPIAKAIVARRKTKPLEDTLELSNLISSIVPLSRKNKRSPATRVFQALRIVVNDEIESLETVLPQTEQLLQSKGRLVVISFHSLEDRVVKNFLKSSQNLKTLTQDVIRPSDREISANSRSRSARLRAAEKI